MPEEKLPAIELTNLSKKFRDKKAVCNIDLNLEAGKIHTLIGPNGAGKTTLLKMIVGLLSPTTGTIELLGKNIQDDPIEAKKLFGYIPDDPSPYEYLTGEEFLAFTGKLRGFDKNYIINRIHELQKLFPISDIMKQPMAYYSRGNKQKLALLSALFAMPRVLLIDEPIVGLDPSSIDIFGNTLKAFTKDHGTVFFVTHTLNFAEDYADLVYIMDKGSITKKLSAGKTKHLKKIYDDTINP